MQGSLFNVNYEKRAASQRRVEVTDTQLEAIWKHVPRKRGKAVAWPLMISAIVDIGCEAVLQATKNWEEAMERERTEMAFVMLPRTFFGKQQHYKDDWSVPNPPKRRRPPPTPVFRYPCVRCGKEVVMTDLLTADLSQKVTCPTCPGIPLEFLWCVRCRRRFPRDETKLVGARNLCLACVQREKDERGERDLSDSQGV